MHFRLRDLLFAHIEDLRNEKESDRELEEQREDQITKEMSGVINNMEASTSNKSTATPKFLFQAIVPLK